MYYPNYDESIVNMMQSIMKFFDIEPYHPSYTLLDGILNKKDYKHVVVLINDGLGYHNLLEHLDEFSFLRTHLLKPISTVFPPTTTAATTSLLSGKYPIEHGWLGWNVFVEEIDDTVTLFLNDSKSKLGTNYTFSVGHTYFPYKDIVARINDETNNRAYTVSPFGDTIYDFNYYEEMYSIIQELCSYEEKSYIYAYYNEPDSLMHLYGNRSDIVKEKVIELDEHIEALSSKLKKTLLIVIADHGHIDIENLFIKDYPSLEKMIVRETSIESRACNFYIKEDFLESFPNEFNKLLGDKFKLLSKEDILDKQLFGKTDQFTDRNSIGDYIAIATSSYALNDSREQTTFQSHHAGGTQREMEVPFIVVDCY